jgi:hypothetical protein
MGVDNLHLTIGTMVLTVSRKNLHSQLVFLVSWIVILRLEKTLTPISEFEGGSDVVRGIGDLPRHRYIGETNITGGDYDPVRSYYEEKSTEDDFIT